MTFHFRLSTFDFGLSRAWRGYHRIRHPADLWLCLRVLGWLCAVKLLVRWVKLPLLLSWLTPSATRRGADQTRVDKIVSLTDTCLSVLPGSANGRCLSRSLVLYRLLRESGLPVVVNFGLTPPVSKVTGHCWLTLAGKVVFEREDSGARLVRMLRHPAEQE
jgi:hypothetical protein